jgi:glutathione S-transferase
MSIRLYSWPNSSASGTRWALEELGVPYEYVVLDAAKRQHRTPEYLAINPNGKVPALVDDGQAYFESLAILLHLGESLGRERGLWPSSRAPKAEALCWTVWGAAELRFYAMQWVYHGLDSPVSYAPKDRSKATADFNHGEYQRLLDLLDARLAGREYLIDGFTLADISPASVLLFVTLLGASTEGRTNVEAWLARCKARPARERAER